MVDIKKLIFIYIEYYTNIINYNNNKMAFQDYKQSHTDIKQIYSDSTFIGQVVTVKGFIKTFRVSGGKGKHIGFAILSDGTCAETLQIIYNMRDLADDKKEYFDDIIKRGKTGMSIMTTGLVVKSPKSGQPIELQAHAYEIYGDVIDADTYPISKTGMSMDFLRTVPHLRMRTDTHSAIARIKSAMKFAICEYFNKHGFLEVQVPCTTENECETGANPFKVTTIMHDDVSSIPTVDGKIDYTQDFYKKQCYLTVSGQLHLEAIIFGIQKAFTFTTAFRAEKSTGPRHAAEFWMMELEFSFGKLEDNMKVNEGCIKYCFSSILEKCYSDLEFLQQKFKPNLIETIKKYAEVPFVISSHAECVQLMLLDIESGKVKIDPEKKPDSDLYTFKEVPAYTDDLSKDHERYITEVLFGGMPVFVRFFPAPIKSFYMPKIDEGADVEHVDGFDLLFPEIGEVVGGSQREANHDKLLARMKEMGVSPETLQFYLDIRKYGTFEHGGSGIGLDRLMMVCTGIFNIRDMIPFPRAYEHCYF